MGAPTVLDESVGRRLARGRPRQAGCDAGELSVVQNKAVRGDRGDRNLSIPVGESAPRARHRRGASSSLLHPLENDFYLVQLRSDHALEIETRFRTLLC